MAEPTLPILDIRDVGKTFAVQGKTITALKGANLSVKRGEFGCGHGRMTGPLSRGGAASAGRR